MDKITCVGTFTLSPAQKAKLVKLVESSPDLLGLDCYSNVDCTSDEDVPSGIAMYFPLNAPVDPTLIHGNLFQVTCASKINGDTLTDAHFADKLGDMARVVEQHPAPAISTTTRHPDVSPDRKAWIPELGGPGSFVGAYYRLRENHRDKDYYLIVKSSIPTFVTEFKQRLSRQPTTTYGDLVNDKLLIAGQYLAKRNAQRNLANAAEAFQVSIPRTEDTASHITDPHHALPVRAVPTWVQPSVSIGQVLYRGKTPAVGLFYGLVKREDCTAANEKTLFVASNPYDGIYVFPLKNPLKEPWMPADTGHSEEQPSTKKIEASCITWERKATTPTHPDLTKGAFKPVNKVFKSFMKQAGWNAEDHVGVLVPLAVKIYDPEVIPQ